MRGDLKLFHIDINIYKGRWFIGGKNRSAYLPYIRNIDIQSIDYAEV
jgi:hypothetical protein